MGPARKTVKDAKKDTKTYGVKNTVPEKVAQRNAASTLQDSTGYKMTKPASSRRVSKPPAKFLGEEFDSPIAVKPSSTDTSATGKGKPTNKDSDKGKASEKKRADSSKKPVTKELNPYVNLSVASGKRSVTSTAAASKDSSSKGSVSRQSSKEDDSSLDPDSKKRKIDVPSSDKDVDKKGSLNAAKGKSKTDMPAKELSDSSKKAVVSLGTAKVVISPMKNNKKGTQAVKTSKIDEKRSQATAAASAPVAAKSTSKTLSSSAAKKIAQNNESVTEKDPKKDTTVGTKSTERKSSAKDDSEKELLTKSTQDDKTIPQKSTGSKILGTVTLTKGDASVSAAKKPIEAVSEILMIEKVETVSPEKNTTASLKSTAAATPLSKLSDDDASAVRKSHRKTASVTSKFAEYETTSATKVTEKDPSAKDKSVKTDAAKGKEMDKKQDSADKAQSTKKESMKDKEAEESTPSKNSDKKASVSSKVTGNVTLFPTVSSKDSSQKTPSKDISGNPKSGEMKSAAEKDVSGAVQSESVVAGTAGVSVKTSDISLLVATESKSYTSSPEKSSAKPASDASVAGGLIDAVKKSSEKFPAGIAKVFSAGIQGSSVGTSPTELKEKSPPGKAIAPVMSLVKSTPVTTSKVVKPKAMATQKVITPKSSTAVTNIPKFKKDSGFGVPGRKAGLAGVAMGSSEAVPKQKSAVVKAKSPSKAAMTSNIIYETMPGGEVVARLVNHRMEDVTEEEEDDGMDMLFDCPINEDNVEHVLDRSIAATNTMRQLLCSFKDDLKRMGGGVGEELKPVHMQRRVEVSRQLIEAFVQYQQTIDTIGEFSRLPELDFSRGSWCITEVSGNEKKKSAVGTGGKKRAREETVDVVGKVKKFKASGGSPVKQPSTAGKHPSQSKKTMPASIAASSAGKAKPHRVNTWDDNDDELESYLQYATPHQRLPKPPRPPCEPQAVSDDLWMSCEPGSDDEDMNGIGVGFVKYR